MIGQVISGSVGKIIIRQKVDAYIELGELAVAKTNKGYLILQVYDLQYGSQLSQPNLEMISGMSLEGGTNLEIMDSELRTYGLAFLKAIAHVSNDDVTTPKTLPLFFSEVKNIEPEHLSFMKDPKNPLFFGYVRSGKKVMDIKINLDAEKVLSHHLLVAAQTGKGKSNFTKCLLWTLANLNYCGALVLDPHDEYYGRDRKGLKDHPEVDNISYYSTNPPQGAKSLKINIAALRPSHFDGIINWSDPQKEALWAAFRRWGENWVEHIIREEQIDGFQEGTLTVLKRRLISVLDLETRQGEIKGRTVFQATSGFTTINDIVEELEKGKVVIVDTSTIPGDSEILIGSLIAGELFRRYKYYKTTGELNQKPVVSIVIEEAPRVIGKEALERGPNIFSTLAREGRKFRIGLMAITQLPSLIPRQILANMSTKVILGIEMAPERQAIIDSSPQDLSEDSRTIASLDIGEAIVTSAFSRFAVPVKVPLFDEFAFSNKSPSKNKAYPGIVA